MELSIASAFSPGGLLGNLSYVLLIASMAMRDIFWLRVLAILSGICGILYDVFWLHDPVGTFWESLFTLVNLLQWIYLLHENKRTHLTPEQERLKTGVFPVLSNPDFLKLMRAGESKTYSPRDILLNQGERVDNLTLILDGKAGVYHDGRQVAECGGGDFVGEIGFMHRTPATATVTASDRMQCIQYPAGTLRKLLSRNPRLNAGLSIILSSNLANKLIRNNATGHNP